MDGVFRLLPTDNSSKIVSTTDVRNEEFFLFRMRILKQLSRLYLSFSSRKCITMIFLKFYRRKLLLSLILHEAFFTYAMEQRFAINHVWQTLGKVVKHNLQQNYYISIKIHESLEIMIINEIKNLLNLLKVNKKEIKSI